MNFYKISSKGIVSPGSVTRNPKDFKSECLATAKKLKLTLGNQKIYLFMSGGMDSECVAEILHKAQIKFTPIIIVFESDLNLEDIKYAKTWCRKNKVKPKIIKFNLLNFLRSKSIVNLSRDHECQVIPYLMLLEVLIALPTDCTYVLGAGEPLLLWRRNKNYVLNVTDEASFVKYGENKKQVILPSFFMLNPELYFSFLTSPEYLSFCGEHGEFCRTSIFSKYLLYNRVFNISFRTKKNGMEKAQLLYKNDFEKIKKKLVGKKSSYTEFSKEISLLWQSRPRT